MCGRSIDTNRATSRLSLDRVSRQPVAVVDVVDLNLFVFGDVRGDHQIVIDGDTSFVMQLSVRHGGSVDLGFEQNSLHAEESI